MLKKTTHTHKKKCVCAKVKLGKFVVVNFMCLFGWTVFSRYVGKEYLDIYMMVLFR
jgi:hypothetical protein